MEQENVFKYELGLEAKDLITGFCGVITARVEFITGCKQYVLQPPVDKDGKIPESIQFDENRMEITGKGPIKAIVGIKEGTKKKKEELGGPQKRIRESH